VGREDHLGPITERQVHLKEALSRWIAVVERIFQVPKEGANDVEDWAKQELWYGKPRGKQLTQARRTMLIGRTHTELLELVPTLADPTAHAIDG
jgi:hypothetical protein